MMGVRPRPPHDMYADIVDQRGGSILRRSGDRNLEFSGQVGEFRVKGRPLANEFAPRPRVFQLVRRHARQVVGSRIADAITAGLDGVHFYFGKFGQYLRNFLELGPVVLNVLPSGEMPVATIVTARDASQGAQLRRGQQTIGNRHPQHRGMALDVQAIAQAQVAKFLVAQLAGQETARLVAKLCDAFVYQGFVGQVIPVHNPIRYFSHPRTRQLPEGMSL